MTHLPLAGSPVIDAGDPQGCIDEAAKTLFYDQRQFLRTVDSNGDDLAVCDIGAVELGDGVPLSAYLPVITSSSSSANLSYRPTPSAVAETGGVMSIGLILGFTLLAGVGALFVVEEEEQEKSPTAEAPLAVEANNQG